MAKNISDGIDLNILNDSFKRTIKETILQSGWKHLRSKLDSILMSNNVMKTNETINACKKIDQLSYEERLEHIASNWGPMYAEKAKPILIQLRQIEIGAQD
jgi:hypothetical protein